MKYPFMVKANGKFYAPGEDVPAEKSAGSDSDAQKAFEEILNVSTSPEKESAKPASKPGRKPTKK